MDTVIRIAFIYFFLMIALRVMGKRELSEMSPFELVTLLMVPEIFSTALARQDYSMTHATIGVATLFTLVFVTSLVTFRFKRVEQIIEGTPTILVHDGLTGTESQARTRHRGGSVRGDAPVGPRGSLPGSVGNPRGRWQDRNHQYELGTAGEAPA